MIYQGKQWIDKYYSDSAVLEMMLKRRYADFKRRHKDTHDTERSGSPKFDSSPGKHKKTQKLLLVFRKLKLREIAEKMKIPEISVFTI